MPLTEESVRKRLLERVYMLVEEISKKLVFYIIHQLDEEDQIHVSEILQQSLALVLTKDNPNSAPQEVCTFTKSLYPTLYYVVL